MAFTVGSGTSSDGEGTVFLSAGAVDTASVTFVSSGGAVFRGGQGTLGATLAGFSVGDTVDMGHDRSADFRKRHPFSRRHLLAERRRTARHVIDAEQRRRFAGDPARASWRRRR